MNITCDKIKLCLYDESVYIKNIQNNTVSFDNICKIKINENEKKVFCPEIIMLCDAKIKYIELIFNIKNNSGETYFYNASSTTNDVCQIVKLNENTRQSMKDLILLKNKSSNENFSLGLVTAKKFYTLISISSSSICINYDMEDKTVTGGTALKLEKYIFGSESEHVFLKRYANTVAELNNARPLRDIPVGWCSWSCYFHDVNEENISKICRDMTGIKGTNLIQIDDGWQKNGSFCGDWFYDSQKFPDGMKNISDSLEKSGKTFGLWLAPLIISEASEHYDELKSIVKNDVVTLRVEGADVHPFDFDNEEFYEHLTKVFSRMKNEYNSMYFKLDFLMASIKSFVGDNAPVRFKSDYRCALLRKAFKTIRDAVGDDVTLLSCGAPILECAGIFDAQRVSCDIIWGKSKDLPSYWEIMKSTTKTSLYRGFYNNAVFRNDPDGLVMRDYDKGDGFDCTYSEARLWASAVAFSGGSVLLNEEYENLSPMRKKLFSDLLPPLGISGNVIDMFEYPEPTKAILKLDNSTSYLAIFNYSDKLEDIDYNLAEIDMENSVIIKCWEKKIVGFSSEIHEKNLNPHGAVIYFLKKIPDRPEFLYSDINLYLGSNVFKSTYDSEGRLIIKAEDKYAEYITDKTKIYSIFPSEFELPKDAVTIYSCDSFTIISDTLG